MSNIPERTIKEQARLIAEIIIDFYKDEKNLKEFEEWKVKRSDER